MPVTVPAALRAASAALTCPVCSRRGLVAPLTAAATTIVCAQAHSFDIARQGYLSLFAGRRPASSGDTADMVAARARFLASDAYRPIRSALVAAAAAGADVPGLLAEVGCGTGYYVAGVLGGQPSRWGVGLDVSTPAVRIAARAHPRLAAVAGDAWARLPLQDGCVAVLLDVFAPRNPPEWARVLAPGGLVLTVTPDSDHLAEVVADFGLLAVDPRKAERLQAGMSAHFVEVARQSVRYRASLAAAQIADLIGMGPNAFHRSGTDALDGAPAASPSRSVSVAVTVRTFRRRADDRG